MSWRLPTEDDPLLIVAAVPAEVRRLIGSDHRKDPRLKPARGWPTIAVNAAVTVVVGGLGRANAAGATSAALASRPYGRVVNVGVAGALPGGGLAVGDAVVATQSIFVEEGVALPSGPGDMRALGFELGAPPWGFGNRVGVDEPLSAAIAASIGAGVARGPIATVARCSGTDDAAEEVAARTGAIAEAMEGAAALLAAHRMSVHAVAEVRVISNTCGHREHQQWDLSAAFTRLDAILERLAGLEPRDPTQD